MVKYDLIYYLLQYSIYSTVVIVSSYWSSWRSKIVPEWAWLIGRALNGQKSRVNLLTNDMEFPK